jgi:hypothetical protein
MAESRSAIRTCSTERRPTETATKCCSLTAHPSPSEVRRALGLNHPWTQRRESAAHRPRVVRATDLQCRTRLAAGPGFEGGRLDRRVADEALATTLTRKWTGIPTGARALSAHGRCRRRRLILGRRTGSSDLGFVAAGKAPIDGFATGRRTARGVPALSRIGSQRRTPQVRQCVLAELPDGLE